MLTAEHARVRRVKGELRLVPLSPAAREEARATAESLLSAAHAAIGASRGEVEAAWADVPTGPSGKRLRDGILKVVADACEFDSPDGEQAAALRRAVFAGATAARAAGALDRAQVLGLAGAAFGLTPDEVEARLYADLPDAHPLVRVGFQRADAVVDAYVAGQAAAVLLRATRVVAEVTCGSAGAYRALFRALKFHRLLFHAEALEDGAYRLTLDGPMSLFQSTRRYGLALALMLPYVAACERWSIVADVAWGPTQEPLVFRARGEGGEGVASAPLPDEVDALRRAIGRASLGWRAEAARRLLPVGAGGVIVPDLCLSRDDGARVYLEVLGYFRREAVFQRVDAARGLRERVLFAASDRLRVSEELLGDDVPASLYIYKQSMSARAVLARADALAARGVDQPSGEG